MVAILNMEQGRKRIVKWVASVGFIAFLPFLYLLVTAWRSGVWLDDAFAELTRDWNAQVITRNVNAAPPKSGTNDQLQIAFDEMRQARLQAMTSAACTHRPRYDTEEGLGFRSRCVLWGKFEEGTLRYEVELKGFWNDWQITDFAFYADQERRD